MSTQTTNTYDEATDRHSPECPWCGAEQPEEMSHTYACGSNGYWTAETKQSLQCELIIEVKQLRAMNEGLQVELKHWIKECGALNKRFKTDEHNKLNESLIIWHAQWSAETPQQVRRNKRQVNVTLPDCELYEAISHSLIHKRKSAS